MYEGAVAGMYFFGIYGGVILIALILGWSDTDWSESWLPTLLAIIYVGVGFGVCLNAKNEVLKREPVMSSVITRNGIYEMTDSTLRCKRGKAPRYTVLKNKKIMDKNDTCVHCGNIFIHHVDSSCVKTDEELEAESMIDYMNYPL